MKSLIIIFQCWDCFLAPAPHLFNAVQTVLPSVVVASGLRLVELQTKVREDFTISEKVLSGPTLHQRPNFTSTYSGLTPV